MALPVLEELQTELVRVYAAGVSVAHGDPRLKKYLPSLQTLGTKAPVFTTLASRLDELVSGNEDNREAKLLDLSLLLYSILYTQCASPSTEGWHEAIQNPTAISSKPVPYSRLEPLVALLQGGSRKHEKRLEDLYESGDHRDPRLFALYTIALRGNQSFVVDYLENTIIPSVGVALVPALCKALATARKDGDERWATRLFKLLYRLSGSEVLLLAEDIVATEPQSSTLIPEALTAMGEDARYEETLLGFTRGTRRRVALRLAAFRSLDRIGSIKGRDAIIRELEGLLPDGITDCLSFTTDPYLIKRFHQEIEKLLNEPQIDTRKLNILLPPLSKRVEDQDSLALLQKVLLKCAGDQQLFSSLKIDALANSMSERNVPALSKILFEGIKLERWLKSKLGH